MKELIKSIIMEYADPMKFHVPKQHQLPFNVDEQEMQNKYFRISKPEEQQALQFIRNRAMDYAVGIFKIQYGHTLTQKGEHGVLSVDGVNKELKKTSEEKHTGERKKDVIQYSAPLIKEYMLHFNIFKNHDGDLAVGYVNPLNHNVKYWIVNGKERLTPMFENDAPKPKAGFNDKGVPQWSPAELYQHFFTITKMEEDKTLDYIRREIVPMTVEGYNKISDPSNHVDVRTVQANLKKVRQGPYRINHGNGKMVRHDVTIWKSGLFTFAIYKQYAGMMLVSAAHPLSAAPRVYKAFTSPPFRNPLNTPKEILNDPIFITEAIENPNWHLNKQEEQRALQFIRTFVFPKVMEEYNEVAAEREVPLIHYGPEEDAVINSLRKFRHMDFPDIMTDQILYIAEFGKWQWVFIIEKVGMGVKYPGIYAGWIDDRWNSTRVYKLDDTELKNPKTAFKKINDYMPYQKWGTPKLLGIRKPEPDELKEAMGDHDLRMSKKEEDFGFYLLKQAFFDERAKKTIRKIAHIRSQAPRHVPDKIVYEVLFTDSNTVAWFGLRKNARTGKLVYFPCDKEGNMTTHRETPLENDDDDGLIESYQKLNLHISKEEEAWALQQLRKRKNNQGEPIGKYLKKIEHTVSTDAARLSDRIKYKNTDDATTYTIVKGRLTGRLGYHAGYLAFKTVRGGRIEPDNYESPNIDDFEVPLHEYVTPPWPDKTELTKMDEARGVQFLKWLTDRQMETLFPGQKLEKRIKKKRIVPSEHPDKQSDKAIYEVSLIDPKLATFTHTFEIYYSNRLGLMIADPINYARYYVDNHGPDDKISMIKENAEKRMVLTKKDEARAVQFIKGIKDPDNGYPLYNKSIKKKFNQPTAAPENISDSAYYDAYLPNLCVKQFRIFMHHKFGLIVRDNTDSVVYKLDQPNPYTAPFLNRLRENEEEEVFPITKKEEAQAFLWLSNLVENGERFGKFIKKAFDGIDGGKHVIKYLVDSPKAVGVFSISKNRAGWIIIRSNYGSVMHIIKHP